MRRRHPFRVRAGAAALAVALAAGALPAQTSVVDTVHNLSSSGPGAVRAFTEQQVCIFCHAPHHTSGMTPLWNRDFSSANYTIYRSSTLQAQPGQPTGSSKLCLSCHDGTIALGSVVSRTGPIDVAGGPFMPAGLSHLGTDLSDDHPISFVYSPALAAADPQVRHPATLPPMVKLDSLGQVQCTTCHDPHSNVNGSFLVMPQQSGMLCNACHRRDGWMSSSHAVSGRAVTGGRWSFPTVAENACQSCHRPHGAGSRASLLRNGVEEENCLNCHAGQVAQYDIAAEVRKGSAHDPRASTGQHDPAETGTGGQPHAECSDCHDPHAAQAASMAPGYRPIGATLLGARGLSIGGVFLEEAQFEYEVCLRCHADTPVPIRRRLPRLFENPDLRLSFGTANPSFHPVAAPSPNVDVPSLDPSVPHGTMLRCTDCHNNSSGRRSGGTGPDGPHGSRFDWLLERNYTTRDPNTESAYEYALCYKCHRRASILADESFRLHRRHVVDASTPCSVCHDSHGVPNTGSSPSNRTHLVNFRTDVVFPSPSSNHLLFRDDGFRRGTCTLLCHGHDHQSTGY